MGSKAIPALHTWLQWQPQNIHSALACQHDLRQVYLVLAAKPVLHFKFVHNGKAQTYLASVYLVSGLPVRWTRCNAFSLSSKQNPRDKNIY